LGKIVKDGVTEPIRTTHPLTLWSLSAPIAGTWVVCGLRRSATQLQDNSLTAALLADTGYLLLPRLGDQMEIETLRKFVLFEDMNDEELERKTALFEPIRRMAGERVTKEDDFGYSLFLVVSGRLSVDAGGEVLAEIGEGDCFGEVSLVTGQKRNATVTALETCELAKIMTWDFDVLLKEHPILARRIETIANERTGN